MEGTHKYGFIIHQSNTYVMKKSLLLAHYEQYNRDIEDITSSEFWSTFKEHENNTEMQQEHGHNNEHWQFHIDGWEYHYYGCSWTVGWQGDYDGDSYFCRINVPTKQEIEDITKLFATSY